MYNGDGARIILQPIDFKLKINTCDQWFYDL